MKAISIWQPWASALFTPLKKIETRHWSAPLGLVGQRFAIHAAKKRDGDGVDFWDSLDMHERDEFARVGFESFYDLPFGALIGSVVLEKCRPTEELCISPGTDEYEWGNHARGRFGWVLKDPIRFEVPISCVGRQGFFNVEL